MLQMFTKNHELIDVRKAAVRAMERPQVGTVLRTIHGRLPVRVHCQVARGTDSEIFAYATLLPLNPELTANGQKWYLRDVASTELAGTKVVLSPKAKSRLLRAYHNDEIFSECDVLPVHSLRVTRIAASRRSLEADIVDMPTADTLELCRELARILMAAGDSAEADAARADFYRAFEAPSETRAVTEGSAA